MILKRSPKRVKYTIYMLSLVVILLIYSAVTTIETESPFYSAEISSIDIYMTGENNQIFWNTTWGGSAADERWATAITTDGFIYCCGTTESFGAGDYDLALIKFAPNGTKLWNITWGGPSMDFGRGVAIDTNSYIYCVGETFSFGAITGDLALVKFAPNGTKLWNVTWGGTSIDNGEGVAVDANNSIYCVGYTTSFGAGNYDLVLVKFTSTGLPLWNTTWGGINGDSGYDVAVDANGSVYCIGDTTSFGVGGIDALALIKFAPNGTKLWNVTWGGIGYDVGYNMAIDINGSIYCIGETSSFGVGYTDFALVKFAPNGTKLWNTTWGGVDDDYGKGIAVDIEGFVYGIGQTYSFGAGGGDFALVKFAPNGTKLWNITWGGVYDDSGSGIAIDTFGSFYSCGETSSFGRGGVDLALIRFVHKPNPPILDLIIPNLDEDGIILLNWSDVIDANWYYIYRELSNFTSVTGLTPKYIVTESQYTDTLTINGTYYYAIVAGMVLANSSLSNCEKVTVAIPPEPEEPGEIPGFEIISVCASLITLIYLTKKKRSFDLENNFR